MTVQSTIKIVTVCDEISARLWLELGAETGSGKAPRLALSQNDWESKVDTRQPMDIVGPRPSRLRLDTCR